MPATVLQIDQAQVKFGDVADPIVPGTLTDYSCQVTRAEITSTANTTTTTVPATFCQAASEVNVPVASTFQLNLESLQDWTVAAGLSAFLFKWDATKKAFALYLDGSTNPVATGIVVVQAGGYGGTPGEPLVSSVTLNIDGYPNILDGAGQPIRNPSDRSSEYPGVNAVANLTALKAHATLGDAGTGKPANGAAANDPAFGSGQYVTLADASKANWDGNAWQAGQHALAAEQEPEAESEPTA